MPYTLISCMIMVFFLLLLFHSVRLYALHDVSNVTNVHRHIPNYIDVCLCDVWKYKSIFCCCCCKNIHSVCGGDGEWTSRVFFITIANDFARQTWPNQINPNIFVALQLFTGYMYRNWIKIKTVLHSTSLRHSRIHMQYSKWFFVSLHSFTHNSFFCLISLTFHFVYFICFRKSFVFLFDKIITGTF